MSENLGHEDHEQQEQEQELATVVPFPTQRVRRPIDEGAEPASDRIEARADDQTRTRTGIRAGGGVAEAPVSDRSGTGATTTPARPGTGRTANRDAGPVNNEDRSEDDDGPVLVDQTGQQPGAVGPDRDAGLPPILPAWVKNRGEFGRQAKWQLRRTYHRVAYHAVRLHVYAGRLAVRSPHGLARLVGGLVRWWFDLEAEPARLQTVEKKDYEAYRRLTLVTSAHRRGRTMILAAGAVIGLIGLGLSWWALSAGLLPWWSPWLVALGVVLGLGAVGRSPDRPVWTPAIVPDRVAKLTAELVVRALGALGISAINQNIKETGGRNWFPSDVARDGAGWRAEVNLPEGVTFEEVIERRAKLASALRRPLGCVWPEGDRSVHEGRLVLWVGDRDLSNTTLPWKLGKATRHDIFAGIPFGADPRGRPVTVPLNQHNLLIGANPGQGKTAAVRVIGCGAALDPTEELWVHEMLGKGDLEPLGKVAHRYVSGVDDESIAYAAESMRLLRQEVMRRTPALKRLPTDLCPDGHITREIANKRSLRLHHLTAIFDEVQNLLAHPVYGQQATDDAEFVIRSGRAVGVTLALATQRPDKNALPAKIRDLVSVRFCLSVEDHQANDMILGTGAHRTGLRATMFRPELDAGIGYLKGATPSPLVVRTAYLDREATDAICDRARAGRIKAGTLTGYAAGDTRSDVDGPKTDVLADLLAVWPDGKAKAWNEVLVEHLAELRPSVYADWTPRQLTAAVEPYDITTGQVWGTDPETGKGANRRGLVRDDIHEAVAKRDKSRGGGTSESTD